MMEPLLLLRLEKLAERIQSADVRSLDTMKTWLLAESNPDTLPFEIMERFVFIELAMSIHGKPSVAGIARQCSDLASVHSPSVQQLVERILCISKGTKK